MVLYAALWAWLAIDPLDRAAWMLENALVFTAAAVLITTRRVLPLSTLSYTMIFVFMCMHAVGAHYTYSLVPYEEAIRSITGISVDTLLEAHRNHYDRWVHFCYGLLLVLPLRELLMLHAGVRGFWSYFLPLDLVVSSSLFYELLEWGAAVVYGGDLGVAFLGTQGDDWDAQRDMLLAGLGAISTILLVWLVNVLRAQDMTLAWLRRSGVLR